MSEINFNCSGCSQNLDAPDDMAGEEIVCPACDSKIIIPAPEFAPEEAPEPMPEEAPAPVAVPKSGKKFVVKKSGSSKSNVGRRKSTLKKPVRKEKVQFDRLEDSEVLASSRTYPSDVYAGASDDDDLPVITPEPMEKTISDKSRLAALLLCGPPWVFLSLHRFYVGRKGSACGQIFTLGGLGIWWLIDSLKILFGSFTDKKGMPLKKW